MFEKDVQQIVRGRGIPKDKILKDFLLFSFHNWELREEDDDWIEVTKKPQIQPKHIPSQRGHLKK